MVEVLPVQKVWVTDLHRSVASPDRVRGQLNSSDTKDFTDCTMSIIRTLKAV